MSDGAFIQIVEAALASAAVRSGPHLTCHPGCSQCCHGVFEITALDAARLREGMSALAVSDPSLLARIETRILLAREHLGPFYPGDLATGLLADDAEAVELFEEWANADPCPLLDPETQTCDLYAYRPILCRTFGPPIRNDPQDASAGLAICELNFTRATENEIAAAEMDSSFRAFEEQLNERVPGGPTIVAFAFQLT